MKRKYNKKMMRIIINANKNKERINKENKIMNRIKNCNKILMMKTYND